MSSGTVRHPIKSKIYPSLSSICNYKYIHSMDRIDIFISFIDK